MQALYVRSQKLGHGAVFEHAIHNRIIVAQFFKNFGVSGVFFGLFRIRNRQFFKQNRGKLFGRIDVELSVCQPVNLGGVFRGLLRILLSQRDERLLIHEHARFFHLEKHVYQRKLDFFVQIGHSEFGQFFVQLAVKRKKRASRAIDRNIFKFQ